MATLRQDRKWRKDHARRFAPDFNALKVLEPSENQLSKILAFLLDSNGSHGQGGLFSRLFAERFELAGDSNTAKAETEVVIKDDRRLDVIVRMQNTDGTRTGFVIENKPWASDQKDQVAAYLQHVEDENLQCLIYLTREGNEPDAYSISMSEGAIATQTRRLRLMSYRYDLVEWLSLCIEKTPATVVRDFLIAVQTHFESICIGGADMTDVQAAQEQCLQSKELFEASLLVEKAVPGAKRQLLEKFLDQTRERAERRGWTLRNREDFGIKWWRAKFSKQPCCIDFNNGSQVDFDFEQNGAGKFWVGVPRGQTDLATALDRLKNLEPMNILDGKNGLPDPDSKWLWYRYSNSYRDWDSADIWWSIKEGKFLDDLFSLIENIHSVLIDSR